MVSELAKGDYEDLRAAGLSPTLEDFDRLNRLALRLTDGAETTAANFPRIGWAGDVPFYQPTCAAFAWYLENVDRGSFSPADKDAAWFYALAHARDRGAFALVDPGEIKGVVSKWLSSLPVTRDEIARACRYAAIGHDDAQPGKTDAQRKADDALTPDERREKSLASLTENVSIASALTGIPPRELSLETPSRLKRMVEEVRDTKPDKSRVTADYQLAYREIKARLLAERAKDRVDSVADGADRRRDSVDDDRNNDAGLDNGETKPSDEVHGENIANG